MEETKNHTHDKGVNLYSKIKIGKKVLEDAILDLDSNKVSKYRRGNSNLASKDVLMQALALNDLETIRAISNYFYKISGIYQKVCNYVATLYRYDWYIVPEIYNEKADAKQIGKEFANILNYFDDSYLTKLCGDIALNVVKNGVYYGYIIDTDHNCAVQELPIKYCRSRFTVDNMPTVEFNMRYFDEAFPDASYRIKILKSWPKEFQQGYVLYKEGKLPADVETFGRGCWFMLEPSKSFKFSLTPNDLPLFINAIPDIIDLDVVEEIGRRKQLQQLAKIIIQKLPLDKNGDLIFDVDEAADIHRNAVEMLSGILGVDVLTTFTEVEDVDLSDTSNVADKSQENAERSVYNALGVTKNLFNTDGNLSVEKSILTDAGSTRSIVLQFEILFNHIIRKFNKKVKKYKFKFYMLETTQYNYKELSNMYKEQVQLGYSKMLPQIAMGHSQSSIINTAYFENNILNLSAIMIPPITSNQMNAETLAAMGKTGDKSKDGTQGKVDRTGKTSIGRPEKPEGEKSDKTLANEESKN